MLGMLFRSGSLLPAGMNSTVTRVLAKAAGVVVGHLVGRGKGGLMKLNKERAAAAAVRTTFSTGANLYLKPGIKANIHYYFDFSEQDHDVGAAEQAAKLIARHLSDLRPGRIGIDGLPGSGKSTLAQALAREMGMEWVCLDRHLYTSDPVDLSRTGVVYEHHRLFRTQNLDEFDVLVYLDEPLETVKRQILDRGRAAAMLEVFDFARMQAVGRKAFQIAAGEAWRVPRTNIMVKRRPEDGFQEQKHLEDQLTAMGVSKIQDLPKEALLFLATFGKAKDGTLAYLQVGRLLQELLGTAAKEVFRQVSI